MGVQGILDGSRGEVLNLNPRLLPGLCFRSQVNKRREEDDRICLVLHPHLHPEPRLEIRRLARWPLSPHPGSSCLGD